MTEDRITQLRALAHPVRVRILSLLTAEAMSAAEVARALDLTHANASYHLRVLHDSGDLVVDSEEKVRGGVAKRYRYDVQRGLRDRSTHTTEAERLAELRATAVELERRMLQRARGASYLSDLESWVSPEAWRRALDLLHEASTVLHEAAQPPGSPGPVHVSSPSRSFTMAGGLPGDEPGWTP